MCRECRDARQPESRPKRGELSSKGRKEREKRGAGRERKGKERARQAGQWPEASNVAGAVRKQAFVSVRRPRVEKIQGITYRNTTTSITNGTDASIVAVHRSARENHLRTNPPRQTQSFFFFVHRE